MWSINNQVFFFIKF